MIFGAKVDPGQRISAPLWKCRLPAHSSSELQSPSPNPQGEALVHVASLVLALCTYPLWICVSVCRFLEYAVGWTPPMVVNERLARRLRIAHSNAIAEIRVVERRRTAPRGQMTNTGIPEMSFWSKSTSMFFENGSAALL